MAGNHIEINGVKIGNAYPTYIIAELSANHNGSLDRALDLMEAVAKTGIDAIKLQTYTADTLTLNSSLPDFQITSGPWKGKNLHTLYSEAYTPWEWHEALFAKGKELGVTVFSSPFDITAVDFLETLDAPAYKIASFELVDVQLIKRVANTGKPLIMSTGMATLSDIDLAVETAKSAGCKQLSLLKCTSAYPADPLEMNLNTIPHLRDAFDVVVGLSDHTLGTAISVASIVLGANIIEKHVTLSRNDQGPDSSFSLEPHEFEDLIHDVRVVEKGLGAISYGTGSIEKKNIIFRRSIYAVKDIKAGETLSNLNIKSIRPGFGLPPKDLDKIIGHRINHDIKMGTPISWDLLLGND